MNLTPSRSVTLLACVAVALASFPPGALRAALAALPGAIPELPRRYVDTTFIPPSGRTIAVAAHGNFQAALNASQPGDVITLEAGATFAGPFTLPNKPGSGWIVVRTNAPDGSLPPPGTRVDISDAPIMPKLQAARGQVLNTVPGAHHYRFIGIEIRPTPGTSLVTLVQLGYMERSEDQAPHHIIIDRCYLHGDPAKGARRGVTMNSKETAVIDSFLADFKEVGGDSQAILGWNGAGPFKIVNNFVEAAGENVMFGGGADPTIPDLVPSDIEIRHNHFSKPAAWKIGDPAYAGTPWTAKNLFELKNARRVLVEGNLFEHSWAHGQAGFAILFTVRNQNGAAPWSVIQDVTFANNVIRQAGGGIQLLGRDTNYPSEQTKRILIRNNLFEEIGGSRWPGPGQFLQILNGTADVVVDHNTALHTGHIILADGAPNTGFVMRNNIVIHNEYGVFGSGQSVGLPSLAAYFPGAIFTHNVIVGNAYASRYPAGNFFSPTLGAVGFVDPARGDYRLARSSAYGRVATDGKDIGVDLDALAAAMPSWWRQAPPP